ncbi:MAG: hypothetical protein RLZ98_797 [Pseudomonadota bacterium]|jgi:peptide deformylase
MAKREIITLPDPLLRQQSAPVERFDDELRQLMDDMLETMYDAPGIGLAAVQVAVPRRVLVVDVANKEDGQPSPICMANPEILWLSDETRPYEEGCLSLPDVLVDIERPSRIRVGYLDRKGEPQEIEADGLLATALQHEIDHLNGRLIIDFLSRLKRDIIVRRFKKQARTALA